MRIEQKSGNDERRILIAMIVDDIVLGRISVKYENRMFNSKWANLVSSWCIKYYNKYQEAPLKEIEDLYELWAVKSKDKHTINLVEKLLYSLSDEYEELKEESNSDYLIDLAGKYFNRIKIQRLMESVQENIDDGDTTKATEEITSYNQIEMGVGEAIDILQDTEAIKEAFAEEGESLIIYPGALGEFFKNALERDAFIGFEGPDKVGKSFWLIDIAFRGMLQRKRVAFFEAGDQSKNQVMRRLMIRVCKRPLYPAIVDYPISIGFDEDDETEVEWEEYVFKGKLSWQKAKKLCKQLMKRKIKSKESYFRLSCHPNSTLSVKGIHSILEGWIRDDWIPDIIVIDYADILDMSHHGLEGRDLIDETWKRLRSLSQIYHCLVVTATQSDTAAYSAHIITKKHFSGDKRKNAHVTGMIGLNQTPEEKEIGVIRLNWVILREGVFVETKCIYVAGCLSIANPAVRSCW